MTEGNYKLLRSADSAPWSWYDLSTDTGETNDLAASQPDKVNELVRHFEQWRESIAADSTRSHSLKKR